MSNDATKIRFRGYLTFADSLKVQKALQKRRRVSPFLVITVVTFAATALAIYKMQVGALYAGFLIVFMAAFMYGGLRLMRRAADRTQQQVYEKSCRKRTGVLTDEAITIRKNKALRSIPWDSFDRALSLDGVVALVRGDDTLAFAKYMFDSEMDWEQARKRMLERYAPSAAPESR